MAKMLQIHPSYRARVAVTPWLRGWTGVGAVLVLGLYGCGGMATQRVPTSGVPGSSQAYASCSPDGMQQGAPARCPGTYSPWACGSPYGCAYGSSAENTLRSVAGALQSLDSASRSAWNIQQTWR